MAVFNEFTFRASDGETEIYVREFIPEGAITGTVQITHGIAEYGARYDDFMKYLAGNGYAVCAMDLPGHGRSAIPGKEGFFAAEDGWDFVVECMKQLHDFQ